MISFFGPRRWLYYALLSAFFAALTTIFGKIGVSRINSNFATFVRTAVVFVFLIVVLSLRHEWQNIERISLSAMISLIVSGLATGLSWLFYYYALKIGPASKVGPVDKLSVVLVLILAFVLLRERFSLLVALGACLVTLGSALIALG